MISYKHSFIFIHIYKVAGTSIRKALRKYAYPNILKRYTNYVVSRISERLDKEIPYPFYPQINLPPHITARELQEELPKNIFDSFLKFAFVRNPWDWQVSSYFFMQQKPSHYQHEIIKEMSFDEFIEWRVNEDLKLQKRFVVNNKGELIIDFIGKFDNLSNDFQTICERIGINASLPYENRSAHRSYQGYYNGKTKNLIAKYYQEDIEFFEFTFD